MRQYSYQKLQPSKRAASGAKPSSNQPGVDGNRSDQQSAQIPEADGNRSAPGTDEQQQGQQGTEPRKVPHYDASFEDGEKRV
jgi:hypothetical protein